MASSPDPSVPSPSTGEDQSLPRVPRGGESEHKPESTPPPRTPNLLLRILTAAVGLPVVFAVVWLGNPLVSVAVSIIIVAAALEFYFLLGMRWRSPGTLIGMALTAPLLVEAAFFGELMQPVLAIALAVLCLAVLSLKPQQRVGFVDSLMWGGVGVYLIAWPLAHFVLLRDLPQGRDWVFYTLVTVFAADSGAYFIGKAFGQRKLAPRISPNKTMEGAGGGTAAAVILGTLAHYVVDLPGALPQVAALSALVALVSMVGDLAESYVKRRVGAKESGKLLPGHGGLLDRLDSVVFTVPLVYYYVA